MIISGIDTILLFVLSFLYLLQFGIIGIIIWFGIFLTFITETIEYTKNMNILQSDE